MNWADFFSMGGYGLYVWGSYALAAILLIANVVLPLRTHRTTERRLRRTKRARTESPRTPERKPT